MFKRIFLVSFNLQNLVSGNITSKKVQTVEIVLIWVTVMDFEGVFCTLVSLKLVDQMY